MHIVFKGLILVLFDGRNESISLTNDTIGENIMHFIENTETEEKLPYPIKKRIQKEKINNLYKEKPHLGPNRLETDKDVRTKPPTKTKIEKK